VGRGGLEPPTSALGRAGAVLMRVGGGAEGRELCRPPQQLPLRPAQRTAGLFARNAHKHCSRSYVRAQPRAGQREKRLTPGWSSRAPARDCQGCGKPWSGPRARLGWIHHRPGSRSL